MSQPSFTPEQLDAAYAALSHAARRAMVTTLAFRPATVSQLAEEHGQSLPAIHKHIRSLENAGLIQRRKVGRTNFVAVNRIGLAAAQAWLGQFRTEWGNDSETLENYISGLGQHP